MHSLTNKNFEGVKMILTLLLTLVIVFLVICIAPFFQWIISRKETEEFIEYEFPSILFDMDLTDLKWESMSTNTVSTLSLRDRGSVRIAHGRVLSKEAMEEKKAAVFSVELP